MSNQEQRRIDNKKGVAEIFEAWSRPIGLVLLCVLLYSQIILGVEANNVAWVTTGILVEGNRIIQAFKK
jgi:hypothetical protein